VLDDFKRSLGLVVQRDRQFGLKRLMLSWRLDALDLRAFDVQFHKSILGISFVFTKKSIDLSGTG